MANGVDHPNTEHILPDKDQVRSASQELEPSKSPKRPRLEDANQASNSQPGSPQSPQAMRIKKEHAKHALPSPSTPTGRTNMTRDQLKYSAAIMRTLKKHRDATPFLTPVDYTKMNIPDYPNIIKYPMDLNTIDRKLAACEYETVEDFVSDVRLVFLNCYKFNGPEAMISMLCQNVESAFEKSLRQMPPSREPPQSDSMHTTGSEKTKQAKKPKAASSSAIRRMSDDGRPKREIHPPPSKDYPEPMTKRHNPRKNDIQMKFCGQALRELRKSKYRNINYPFLAPVDVVALNIPDYPLIIKNPMDLSTIERKLNEGDYDSPDAFEADIRLMFSNCYTYNPPVTPVHKMGRELEKVFDEKWKQMPQPPPPEPEKLLEEEFEDEDESDDDVNDERIRLLERNLASLTQEIASIKSSKRKRAEKQASKGHRASRPTKEKKATPEKRHTVGRALNQELPEFTFEQKKDLSERINSLTGERLNTVVSIIQSSMPNLDGQGQDEIVLDIDALDPLTLHKLHEFVTGKSLIRSKKPHAKRTRVHRSEEDSDRRIRALEQTLEKFEKSKDRILHDDQNSSSDSDSESSSGSDSDDSGSNSN